MQVYVSEQLLVSLKRLAAISRTGLSPVLISSDEDVLKRHRAMFDRRDTMGRITGSLERQLWW